MSRSKLSADFRSLYRLCLRASSASVLHHGTGTANLRRLIRPTFDAAASVTEILRRSTQASMEQMQSQAWLSTWEKRVDSTLALMYTSSQSRGLPHKLTRNLGLMVLGEHQRLIKRHPQKAWDPKKPLDPKKEEKAKQSRQFVANAWASLSQVVKLAEGRDGISLGRLTVATVSRKRRFK